MPVDPKDPSHTELLIPVNGRQVQRIWHSDCPLFERTRSELISTCLLSDYEVCGFIDSEHDVHYVQNVHDHPKHNFLMDNPDAQNTLDNIYETLQLEVLGIFHSHPNNHPWPTTRDIVGWPDPTKLDWRYFIILGDDVLEWALD